MKKLLLFFMAFGLIVSCSKDDDRIGLNPDNPNPNNVDATVQDFMWKAMNLWYFWQQDVPDLADNRFSSDEEYTSFLVSTPDPGEFFNDVLLFSEDRFSFFNSDYRELVNDLSGISLSNGLEFGLFFNADTEDVWGVVEYIIPNSDASTKDIMRGEVFFAVDGTPMNLGNYEALLFGENVTYTLGMGELQDRMVTPNGKEVTLTKEVIEENPVFITKTFEIGASNIGYLMYNRFTNEFDEELNQAFGTLKTEGVTDLILDLRYNRGGSVNSSVLLASLIYGANTDETYIRQRWNDKLNDILADEDNFVSQTGAGTPINTLNLNRVYILTTNSTASSSELIINGLNPYIEVILIGSTTRGKNEFSITMVDDPDREGAPYLYSASRENQINPNNSYAIQPLVGRNENSVGFSDYVEGFPPTIELAEDIQNMGVLGDANEPLLARAIQEITTPSARRDFTVSMPFKLMTSSGLQRPMKDNMVLDKPLNITLE